MHGESKDSTIRGLHDILNISPELAAVFLFPPYLYELSISEMGYVNINLDACRLVIDKDAYSLFRGLEKTNLLLKRFIRKKTHQDKIVLKINKKYRYEFYHSYILSRFARSKREFLTAWIAIHNAMIQALESQEKIVAGTPIVLPDEIEIGPDDFPFKTAREIGVDIGINFNEFVEALGKYFQEFYTYEENKAIIFTIPILDYTIYVARTLTGPRVTLMNIICTNPPIHTYALVTAASEILHRKKSWIYKAIEDLEQLGLIKRYRNIHPKVTKRKKRIEKIIVPTCLAYKLGPCRLKFTDYDITIEIKKPKEFVCIRGYRENEAFQKPNQEAIKEFAERIKKNLKIKTIKPQLQKLLNSNQLQRTPCQLYRYVLENLYNLLKAGLSIKARGIETTKNHTTKTWNLIQILNQITKTLDIKFEIEYEEKE